jgi:hypothetical protein
MKITTAAKMNRPIVRNGCRMRNRERKKLFDLRDVPAQFAQESIVNRRHHASLPTLTPHAHDHVVHEGSTAELQGRVLKVADHERFLELARIEFIELDHRDRFHLAPHLFLLTLHMGTCIARGITHQRHSTDTIRGRATAAHLHPFDTLGLSVLAH